MSAKMKMSDIDSSRMMRRRGRAVLHAVLLSCMAIVALASMCATAADGYAAADVRGVSPEEQQHYTSGAFECVVRGELKALEFTYVNDNYCDCDNGEDEPGTSACSHMLSSVFYCGNGGYFPKKVRLISDITCARCH